MLYVGLLEAPYAEMRATLILRFLIGVFLVSAAALVGALLLVRRTTRPLGNLSKAPRQIALGDWDVLVEESRTYSEIMELSQAFRGMQRAIGDRDLQLRHQNIELTQTNEKLQLTNDNYMKMLSFVTHELRSPIATIQTMVDALIANLYGVLPEKANHSLVRIKRNCEELADMTKDYLDLSRAERGELEATKSLIDVIQEVVEACVSQYQALFASRQMELEVNCPEKIMIVADVELMRIALGNFLSNAAKYGKERGRTELKVVALEGQANLCVWNEGPGFSEMKVRSFSRDSPAFEIGPLVTSAVADWGCTWSNKCSSYMGARFGLNPSRDAGRDSVFHCRALRKELCGRNLSSEIQG